MYQLLSREILREHKVCTEAERWIFIITIYDYKK